MRGRNPPRWHERQRGSGSSDADWLRRGEALLGRYEVLAATHTRCGKHRRPRENIAILRVALRDMVHGRPWTTRGRGLVQTTVDAMLRKRGVPGSARHTEVRAAQAAVVAAPTHHALARVLVGRLAALPQDIGTRDVDRVLAPVEGVELPSELRNVVRRAYAGTVDELVAAGGVSSAEVLADLVPQIAATTVAAAYPDEALRTLMASNYLAFRKRRSLLLLNLEHQVRLHELPWVRAVAGYRAEPGDGNDALTALRHLGELTLDGFPGTPVPDKLVRELATLSREAALDLPWVEGLAADIFMGRFSAKFLAAAKIAGELLDGTLYARYYRVDYRAVAAIDDVQRGDKGVATSPAFDALCDQRAGVRRRWGNVAENGMIIEQAQILTTHNLATLIHSAGVRPAAGWMSLAEQALRSAARSNRDRRSVAASWRQMVFFLSLAGDSPDADRERAAFAGRMRRPARGLSGELDGLLDGTARPLLGWRTRDRTG